MDHKMVRLGVRMYKDLAKLKALKLADEGATKEEIAHYVGVSKRTVFRWLAARRALSVPSVPVSCAYERRDACMDSNGLYDPPRSGPLAGLEPSQIENLLLRAVLADLKAGGWAPDSISNRSKCELGERLRMATGLPLRQITDFLKISKSSYEYHKRRLGSDRYAHLRGEVRELFEESAQTFGYRRIWAKLRRRGERVSEKVVRRIMREEGLSVIQSKQAKKHCSYKGEITDAPRNLVRRRFHAECPDRLWLTDMTEFALPGAGKVYLNPIIDAFDGAPIAWRIGQRPTKALSEASLEEAISKMSPGSHPVIHSDRGVHYRTPSWIAICDEAGIVRSMSRKGCCADNSACEGFFGRLKMEFFYGRDWSGISVDEFAERLDSYLRYYRDERIKQSLGWLSPKEYRGSLGYTA